ncbi:MAG: baseplate J/gp47 family protein, partial [Ardenticatenaceae bacterium]
RREALLRRRAGAHTGWGESILLAGFLFGMMILFGAVLLLLVPGARITLVPRQIPFQATFPATVDPAAQELDIFNVIVPGQAVSLPVQGVQEIATSGHRDVPAGKAMGEVLFLNVTGQPVTIPPDTLVATSSGTPVRFRTLAPLSLPGELNARASVPVEAVNPGPAGNVNPLQINVVEGPAASTVRVLNERGTEGGDVQQRAVVTAADKEQLREQLRQRLLQEGQAALQSSLLESESVAAGASIGNTPTHFIVPGSVSIEVTAETYSGSVDDQLDVLSLDLRARVSTITVSQEDIERLAIRALRDEVPTSYRMTDDGFDAIAGDAQRDEAGLLVMAVRAEGIATAELSADVIRSLVRGQPLDEAYSALIENLPLAADPAINLWPDWWSRMPYLPLRIFVRVGVPGTDEVMR